MFAISFGADVANFSANLLCYEECNFKWCLWGFALFWALRDRINQFHPRKHYFEFDLGQLNWFTRETTVLCLKMAQKHSGFHAPIWQSSITESTGDCGQMYHLPSKIQFSESHCGTFYLQFSFLVIWVKQTICQIYWSLDIGIHSQ